MTLRSVILAGCAVASLSLISACGASAQSGFSSAQKEEFGDLVRAYLLENPEVVEEALIALRDKRDREASAALTARVSENAERLYSDPRDPVVGPADAPVTIVEFYDYNCGFCKSTKDWLRETLDENDGKVRVVFKELPLLDGRAPGSREAARAALAAKEQDKFLDFHFALMEARGGYTSDKIDQIAREVGIDVAAMREQMKNPAVERQILDVFDLAQAIGVEGTPFFLVNGQPIPGADMQTLDALVQAGLQGG